VAPVTTEGSLATRPFVWQGRQGRAGTIAAGVALVLLLGACDLPFGLGSPTTRALEVGAAGSLSTARSFELKGSYIESGTRWSIDLQVVRPSTQHVTASNGTVALEAILIDTQAYFRGRDFLTAHLGDDPGSQSLVKATGDAWWKGSASAAPNLSEFTDGNRLRTAFLGSAVTRRGDHASVDGVAAIDLSGPRADVFIAEADPHPLLRLVTRAGAEVDGITAVDFRFSNFDHDFGIVAPSDVIDFANLSTLPPSYTVVSVDTSRCGSPCLVAAEVKNLGGTKGARAPSTVTFKLTDSATGFQLGSCQTLVQPDVGYNATATVACTIAVSTGLNSSAATVTATPDNPGRG
jgi:hypothetical protein